MKRKLRREKIGAPEALNEPIEYGSAFSRGIAVEAAGAEILFISGTASVGARGESLFPRDFLAQAQRTFENIDALLASRGFAWRDVVQTRCYLKSMEFYGAFNKFRNKFFKKCGIDIYPASVCVEANLCRPELMVEVEAIAVRAK